MNAKNAASVAIFLGLIVILGVFAWYWMGGPMYRPGGLHASALLEPPPQPAGGDYWVMAPNVRLYHYADGSGPDVLVVHGGPGYPIHKPPAGLRALDSQYRFEYYDQRGCGKSSRPVDRLGSGNFYQNMQALDAALGLGAQVSDIERIRRILHDDKLILLGHSFGGFLAAMYAAEFPEHVKGLILVAPATVLVMPQKAGGLFEEVRASLPAGKRAAFGAFLNQYLDFHHVFDMSEAELAAMNVEFARYYETAAAAHGMTLPSMADTQDAGGWMVQAMYLSMGRWHDYREALRKVTAPVLVIHGARDLQTEAESRAYAQCFPHARFVVIPDAGHFPFAGQPDEFASAAGQFLRELNGTTL